MCTMWATNTPIQAESRCFTHPTKASWSEATDICAVEDLRIVTLDDLTNQDLTKVWGSYEIGYSIN